MKMHNNKSPLRYPGGKTRACKKLDELIQQYFPNMNKETCIISPFFGGGSFEFYLQNKYNSRIVANDLFKPLYSFWSTCIHSKETLCDSLFDIQKNIPITKIHFQDYRKRIMETEDVFEQARMYFIINRCSFSGATLSGGFSKTAATKRFTKSSIERVQQLNLSNFSMYNMDFSEFINTVNGTSSFMFLDPPYYLKKKSRLYGKNGDLHEHFDHEKLAIILLARTNWFLTYNDDPYIRKLYKGCTILEVSWSYGMCNVKKNTEIAKKKQKKSSEIVIIKNI